METVDEVIVEVVSNEKTHTKTSQTKRKPNHFYIYNKNTKKYDEVKYLTQKELAEGFRQVLPTGIAKIKKSVNHFSITLCFLPEHLWSRLHYDGENYKKIKDNNTIYSIVETNQDDLMVKLFNELNKRHPDSLVVNYLINELDDSQYSSWLVLRAKHYLSNGRLYEPSYVTIDL